MSETDLIPVVKFGKYKGQPVTSLIADKSYCDWLRLNSDILKKDQVIYNIVVNQSLPNTNSRTPEHNRMQNLFLNSSNRVAFLKNVIGIVDDPPDVVHGKQLELRLSQLWQSEDFIKHFGKVFVPTKTIATSVKFESIYNWDMVLDSNMSPYMLTFQKDIGIDMIKKEMDELHQMRLEEVEMKFFQENVTYSSRVRQYEVDLQFYLVNHINNKFEVERYTSQMETASREFETFRLSRFEAITKKHGLKVGSRSHFEIIFSEQYTHCEREFWRQTVTDELDAELRLYKERNPYPRKVEKLTLPTSPSKPKRGYVGEQACTPSSIWKSRTKEAMKDLLREFKDWCMYDCDSEAKIVIYDNSRWKWEKTIYCEIKPILGDDYPCVLRKMLLQKKLTLDSIREKPMFCLIVGRFSAESATWEDLKKIFTGQHGISIIFIDDFLDDRPDSKKQRTIESGV